MTAFNVIPKVTDHPYHHAILARLPTEWTPWPDDSSSVNHDEALSTFAKRAQKKGFSWPKKPVVFISGPPCGCRGLRGIADCRRGDRT